MANSHVQGLSLRTQVHVMTLGRTNASINEAEDAGRMDVQIESADALRRIFTTVLASHPISWLDPPGDLMRPKFSNI